VTTESTWVDADATRLEQIVGNLLSNAIKYTERDGHIAISVTAEGQEAVLRVRDDGAGIERHLLPRVFDAFVQGDRTLNRAHGGLGIGLTLVRRLVELHGGDVSARSGGVKQGSTFEVRLPRRAAPEHRPVAGVTEVIAVKRRVLIVEDNRDAGDMYRMLLELAGHEVLLAADGPSGLEMLKSARPDIALVDIGLPGMDGYELAKRFRAEAGADRVVLVALTGYGSSNDRERSKRAGFDHHLTKPVDADALRSLLGGHL